MKQSRSLLEIAPRRRPTGAVSGKERPRNDVSLPVSENAIRRA